MKKIVRFMSAVIAGSCLFLLNSCDKDDDNMTTEPPVVKPDQIFYGVTASNQLVKFNANASQTAIASINITGLAASEKILAIDFRPATGQLYGIGVSSRLYTINHENGAAVALGAAPFTPVIGGSLVGFDFNPTVDRIRMVTSAGQNLRLHPETGAVAAVDGALNPGSPVVVGAAYTNSFAGAATTTLFDLDMVTKKMYKQDPPNNGTLVEVGSFDITSGNESGFDISADNSVALATFNTGGKCILYQMDLTTGKATSLGEMGTAIIGLAIPTAPVAYAIDNSTNNLLIFDFTKAGTPVSKAVTGMQPGETILGIDFRPATAQLYALGSTSRLYTVNLATGAAAAILTGPQFSTMLTGTSFGFDFNPTVDRIRVVSNTGQNLRLNPLTGDIAAVDMPLNPGTPAVSASAYTNNFSGATTTVLYNIDPSNDKLYMQNPPNNGTLVEVGNLGINLEANNGFDIGSTTGKAYTLATVGGATKVYSINLMTGAATELATFTAAARGFSVGLGF